MPDGSALALARVGAYVAALPGNPRALYPAEVWSYAAHGVVAGWRIEVAFTDRVRRLDILVRHGFPRTAPRIALVDRPAFLTWAHVEGDGGLCLLRNTAETDPYDPVGTLIHLLSEACGLVEGLIAGKHVDDMRDEFLSYWNWKANGDGRMLRSLLDPLARTRKVRLWTDGGFRLVAETDEDIEVWLDRLEGGRRHGAHPRTTRAALALALERPLLPFEYPLNGADLMRLAERSGAEQVLADVVLEDDGEMSAILMAPGTDGVGLVGVVVPAERGILLSGGRTRRPQPKGYRAATLPRDVKIRRRLGARLVRRLNVHRVDHSWVHGRGADFRAASLRGLTVLILGCGSVGGAVALALAQAGVGRLVLIDPEALTASNVGRHFLGMDALGKAKASAMAAQLGRMFPHVQVEHRVSSWQSVWAAEPELFAANLVVSAIGSWSAEGELDDWRRAHPISVPVVYGWTEAHAVAGHAVALFGEGCLGCGLSKFGEPLLSVASWPEETVRRETGCGSFYQPYGPIELMNINAMVSALALDCLLGLQAGSTHLIWCAGDAALQRSGGAYTPEFQRLIPAAGLSSFTLERPWCALGGCRECGRSLAA